VYSRTPGFLDSFLKDAFAIAGGNVWSWSAEMISIGPRSALFVSLRLRPRVVVRRVLQHRALPERSAEIGSGSTPGNGAGLIATDAAASPRPARRRPERRATTSNT
jgi:hypothetical protein